MLKFLPICLLLSSVALAQKPGAPLRITVHEKGATAPLPCRIHLLDEAGQRIETTLYPCWKGGFVCDGAAELILAPGDYRYEIEHGPEWSAAGDKVTVKPGVGATVDEDLHRLANLSSEGWWSGETHSHRALDDAEILLRAEDLFVAGFITWWNEANPWAKATSSPEPVRVFDGGKRFAHALGGEDERDGGALLYFHLPKPLAITGSKKEWPLSTTFLTEAKKLGAWVDAEKPFWNDIPAWLASGQLDSIGIAHNHMQRGGVMDNEAWGRLRDLKQFPGAHGNGLWSQEIYYHILNCGLRLPPSAGSASGVLANPVGYNRVYVHLDEPLTDAAWWAGLKAGRSFVTNGPLLRVKANGRFPGEVFKAAKGKSVKVELTAQLDSRDPVRAIEIIRNGHLERTVPVEELQRTHALGSLEFRESGWFIVRAIADMENFRFASSAPFYVEIGDASRVSKVSAQFFLDWSAERGKRITLTDPAQLAEAQKLWETTATFWAMRVAEANAP